jgi:hypothetical protein
MPDWIAYVKARFGTVLLAKLEEQEIIEELAAHLEDTYLSLRAEGVGEPEARRLARQPVDNWQELRNEILSAKEEGRMQGRIEQIWVPSLVTFVASYVSLAFLQWAGARPLVEHPSDPGRVMLCLPWLLMLPFIGAIGGYLSRRSNGVGWRVYVAASLPALVLGVLFILLVPVAMVVDAQVPASVKGAGFLAGMLSWVILPAAALSLGAALQRFGRTRSAHR